MIPVRVHLRDFLCYDRGADGGAVTFEFEGSRLWSISGDNGAGKSAIFDAIRYVLYGEHRDGSQHDARLIRRGAAACDVAFEFRSDERLYRVRRTVGRARGKSLIEPKTWQAALYDNAEQDWVPIPGTDAKDGLDSWVEERLGLTYRTFIASVLLLQGESDQLTRAKSKERFEILSGLLALEAYERLAAAARDRAKSHRSESQQLETKLLAQPAVRPEDLEQAANKSSLADQELVAAQETVEQTAALMAAARSYEQLVLELGVLQAELARIDALLTNAPKIREEHTEWSALSEQLPRMRQGLLAIRQADTKWREASETAKRAAGIDVGELKEKAEAAASREHTALAELDDADEVLEKSTAALEALRAKLAVVEQSESVARRLADLAKDLAAKRAKLGTLPSLERASTDGRVMREALPHIRLIREREATVAARRKALATTGSVASWESEISAAQKAVAKAEEMSKLADGEQKASARALARAEEQDETARSELEAREAAKDEAVCSRCGQKISPQHIKFELAEARKKLTDSTAALRHAKAASAAAVKAATAASAALRRGEDALSHAKVKHRDAQSCARELTAAETDLAAARQDATKSTPAVRDVVRRATQDHPTLTVGVVEEQVRALPALERQLEELRTIQGAAQGLETQIAREQANLTSLEQQLPANEQPTVKLEASHRAKEREAARSRRSKAQTAHRAARDEAKRSQDALQAGQAQRQELEAAATELKQGGDHLREQALLRLEGTDPETRGALLGGDENALKLAERRLAGLAHAPTAYAELTGATDRRLGLAGKVEAASGQVSRTPPEQRISIDASRVLHSEATARLLAAQRGRDDAREGLRELRARSELRLQLETEYAASRRRGVQYGKLADLLGRSGLQAVLMDEAIAGIGALANETLNRISGGQLELVLERETTGKGEEIKIQAIDLGSSDDPLDIAFLSGSQKFRVSVALAAGIGQYAAGAGRIRALIIDEGFGSLDSQGRQEMVDELHRLSEILDRVIVVSHQEDFQDRTLFPTGYVLHKANQRTEVVRFV